LEQKGQVRGANAHCATPISTLSAVSVRDEVMSNRPAAFGNNNAALARKVRSMEASLILTT